MLPGYTFRLALWMRASDSMSIGSAAIPLLKAAPEADQLADRLEGGPWSGLELCLLPGHVRDDHPPFHAGRAGSIPSRLPPRGSGDRTLPSLLCRGLPRPRRQAADRERAASAANASRGDLPLAHRGALARPQGVA